MKVEEVRAEYATLINPGTMSGERQWKAMGDIAEVVGGGTPRTSDPSNFENGDIPWLTPADLSGYTEKYVSHGARFITRKGLESSSARILPAGSVLFTSRAPIGYVAIARNPIATNQGFKSFVLKEGILPEYVYWWLKGAKQTAESLASGTTFLELSGANAKKLPIPIVPLDQQKRIVAEIEKQFSRLDEAVANLKRVKANLKRYKAAVLKAAVEGRLVETEAERARREGRSYETGAQLLQRILEIRRSQWQGKGKYKEPTAPDTTDLPELPEGWVWTLIGEAFDVFVGATPSRAKPEYWNGGIPWVSSGEVAFCRIKQTRETISADGLENSSTYLHPAGTVLLGMIGEGKTRGQVAILDIEACNNQNSAAIRVSETKVLPEYIYSFLEKEYEDTRRRGSGGNQPALNKERVRQIPFPLPPVDEQKRIMDEINHRLSVVHETEAQVNANIKRAEGLRQSILSRAFTETSMAGIRTGAIAA